MTFFLASDMMIKADPERWPDESSVANELWQILDEDTTGFYNVEPSVLAEDWTEGIWNVDLDLDHDGYDCFQDEEVRQRLNELLSDEESGFYLTSLDYRLLPETDS